MPYYKQAMDRWFAQHPKYEREFQQLVERDNNRHGEISHATDYYIVDTELVYEDARFDMVAVHCRQSVWYAKTSTRQSWFSLR